MIQQTIRGFCPTYAQVCDRAIELAVSGCLIQQKTTTQNTQRQAQKIIYSLNTTVFQEFLKSMMGMFGAQEEHHEEE
jgi:glutamine phosphoribosylpyrophosphate amidotransferase